MRDLGDRSFEARGGDGGTVLLRFSTRWEENAHPLYTSVRSSGCQAGSPGVGKLWAVSSEEPGSLDLIAGPAGMIEVQQW